MQEIRMANSISEILEKTKEEMCDNFCKYPCMEPPKGKDKDWLFEDENSPCNKCPLNNL